jgi:hypothetical protein
MIGDAGDGGTWMTKAELAAARGISIESVERLMRRHRWRRQPGNDNRVRVLVPPDWLAPRESDPPHRPPPLPIGDPPAHPPPLRSDGEAVETVLSALREAHAGELGRLTEALATERSRVDALIASHRGEITAIEAKLSAETARADGARREVHELANRVMVLQRDADRAETDLAVARADGTTMAIEAERLRGELDDAQAAGQRAQERADVLARAETARQARGVLARLRAALRGE